MRQLLVFLAFSALACQSMPTEPVTVKPEQITLSQLRGTWRSLDRIDKIAYCVFDTVGPTYKIKVDYGWNFRWENDLGVVIRDNQLFASTDQSRMYWVSFNTGKDTLSLFMDSLKLRPQKFIRDNNAGSLDDWMTRVATTEYIEYPLSLNTLSGLAYSDSTWFVFTRYGNAAPRVYAIRLNPVSITSYALSDVYAIDATDGVLWCLRPGVIDKRRIKDTVLLSQIPLPFQDTSYGIAVLPDRIYVHRINSGTVVSSLVTLSHGGQIIRSDSTWSLIDLASVNQVLYCCHTNDFYKVDPLSGHALASYKFINYLGQPNAVANYNGRLAVAFLYPNLVRIGILPPP